MAEQLVLRKRNRDLNRVCTSYVVTSTMKFTLETCDPVVANIRDSRGNLIAVLTEQSPSTVVNAGGTYNICLEGEGVGTLWVQPWSDGGEVEDCCDELRAKDAELQNLINSLETRVTNIINGSIETGCCVALEQELNDLKDRVDALEQSGGASADCCNELRQRLTVVEGDITELKNRMTAVENRVTTVEGDITNITNQISQIADTNTVTTIVAGNNVSVTDTGTDGNHIYTISATGGSGGGTLPIDFDITNGANVQVQRNGNEFTISATDTVPDVDKAYVDAAIAGVADTNTVTTLTAGTGISITDTGTGGNHAYTVSTSGGALPADFNITNGANVQVVKSGNTYTISATDTDTVPDVDKAYVDAAIAGIGEANAHAAMPSDYYEEVTLDSSGFFIAPADGYLQVDSITTGNPAYTAIWCYDSNDVTYFEEGNWLSDQATGRHVYAQIPVSKGRKISIYNYQCTFNALRFIYANGSVPANP